MLVSSKVVVENQYLEEIFIVEENFEEKRGRKIKPNLELTKLVKSIRREEKKHSNAREKRVTRPTEHVSRYDSNQV